MLRILSLLLAPLALSACVTNAVSQSWPDPVTAHSSGAATLLPILDAEAGSDENVFFSPLSIDYAFGIVALGAKGETAQQLATVLPPPRDPKDYAQDRNGVEVRLASRLWVDRQFRVAPDFQRSAQALFDAGAEAIDKTRPQESANTINAWADRETSGLIPEVVSAREVDDPDLALFITNALYFDGAWETEFDSRDEQPFLFGDGTNRDFTLMQQVMSIPLVERDGWRAVRLPYQNDRYAMDVIMPAKREVMAGAPPLATISDFGTRLGEAKPKRVDMRLPRFEIDTDFDLIAPLRAIGLSLPFDAGMADLSGIGASGARNLYISGAKQLAKLQVFNTGTRAAAVTVVKIITTGARIEPERPIPFTVDRPFIVVIRDLENDAMLFLGRIADPQAFEPEEGDDGL